VEQVSDAITAELKTLLPGAEEYLDARAAAWEADLAPYRDTITAIKDARSGSGVGATESVFDYMAEAAGLVDRTPAGWQRAAANESDPGPGDVAAFETALGDGSMDVLVYNTQTEGAITEQVRDAAVSDSVPVVNVTETVPDGQGWVDWQVGQLKALQTALGSG
jgi:zinc/manganese transport system substrate-binding protein